MKPELTAKGLAILEEVQRLITEMPDRLAMYVEVQTAESSPEGLFDFLDGMHMASGKVHLQPECGVTGCLIGWITIAGLLMEQPGLPILEAAILSENGDRQNWAADLLGVSGDSLDRLYYTDQWPEAFLERFRTRDLKTRARVFCERVQHWIDTGV